MTRMLSPRTPEPVTPPPARSGPSRGVYAPSLFPTVNRFCMAVLHGFARRLTAQNGGFRPGQCPRAGRPVPGPECSVDWGTNVFRAPTADGPWTLTAPLLDVNKVRKAPSRPRSWASSSLFELYSHRNARANLFWPT